MAPKLSTLKRPAAALSIKTEPKSPKVPRKPAVAAVPEAEEKPEVAAVPEAEEKPEVASMEKKKPKSRKGELPPPGKEAWKDVHTQVMKLQKQGKGALRNAWEKAKQEGSQQAKRDFYYNVFLLDPAVSKKEVHKESLERLSLKQGIFVHIW